MLCLILLFEKEVLTNFIWKEFTDRILFYYLSRDDLKWWLVYFWKKKIVSRLWLIRKKRIRIELWTGHSGLYSDKFPSEFNYYEMNNSTEKKEREKKKKKIPMVYAI